MKRTKLPIFAMCLAAGVATFATEVVVVWMKFGDTFAYGDADWFRHVTWLQGEIDRYMAKSGQRPQSIEDACGGESVPDAWGHPFRLTSDESQPIVYSLGRDDLPGGAGIDSDIYSDRRLSTNGATTFAQFLSLPRAKVWLLAAGISSLAVALACWIPARRQVRNAAPVMQFAGQSLIYSGLALGVALLMAVVYSTRSTH
ncbi:MAG: hypothetical protein ACKVX7_09320 [Planctomycetota bacterium]